MANGVGPRMANGPMAMGQWGPNGANGVGTR